MVLSDITELAIRTAALAEFDSMTHIGFGTGTATPLSADTDLTTPIIRVAFDETAIKNIPSGTYDFSGILGLTEGNTNTMGEIGLFNAPSAGTMTIKKLLTTTVPKSATVELSLGLRVSIVIS